ncbi:MAG: hypothetical protein ACOCYW_09270, partial [Roseicyclus sp.]
MGRHTGKNGTVTLGDGAVVAVTGFDIEETVGETDFTAAGDSWRTHGTTFKEWSGTVNMLADWGATGQDLRAGDEVAFEGYTEGNSSGRTYLSGTCTITSHGVDSP